MSTTAVLPTEGSGWIAFSIKKMKHKQQLQQTMAKLQQKPKPNYRKRGLLFKDK